MKLFLVTSTSVIGTSTRVLIGWIDKYSCVLLNRTKCMEFTQKLVKRGKKKKKKKWHCTINEGPVQVLISSGCHFSLLCKENVKNLWNFYSISVFIQKWHLFETYGVNSFGRQQVRLQWTRHCLEHTFHASLLQEMTSI